MKNDQHSVARERERHSSSESPIRRKSELLSLCSGMRLRFAVLAICVLFVRSVPSAAQQDSAGEYELKAAMLLNLIQFADWPSSTYSDSRAPTVLCILGWDPFGRSLTSQVAQKFVDGRPVQIRHLKDIDSPPACHVLYISSSERKSVVQVLSDLKGSSVLTVGEMGQFAARGGIVQFTLDDKRLVLEINLDAANRADVKISSRLLAISRIVKDEKRSPARQNISAIGAAFEKLPNSWQ